MYIYGTSLTSLIVLAVTVWMLIYCYRNDPDRGPWMLVILFFPFLGAFLYFLIRYLPTKSFGSASWINKFTRGKELKQLKWKCRQIGNAHQWIEYGDALRSVGKWDEADAAYKEAVAKENDSLPARWGAATTAFRQKRFADAREHLEKVIAQDSRYKFGDATLLLGKTYVELTEIDRARNVLSENVNTHGMPEAVYRLGKLEAESGNADRARTLLEGLIDDLEQAPRAIARKSAFWKSRSKKLLRSLK